MFCVTYQITVFWGGARISQRGLVKFLDCSRVGGGGGAADWERGARYRNCGIKAFFKLDWNQCAEVSAYLIQDFSGIFLAQRSCRKNKEKAGYRAPKRPGRKYCLPALVMLWLSGRQNGEDKNNDNNELMKDWSKTSVSDNRLKILTGANHLAIYRAFQKHANSKVQKPIDVCGFRCCHSS